MHFNFHSVAPLAMVPVDETYNQGDDVILECNAAMGGPGNTFQWFDSLNSILTNSSMLTLTNVMAADGGMYTCMITNAGGSDSDTTSVFIAPYFTSQPQAMGGDNGTMVTLTCEAEAFPAPTYQWSRGDGRMIRTEVMGQDSAMLTFDSLSFGDEGDYICNATSMGMTIQSQPVTLSGKNSFLLGSH